MGKFIPWNKGKTAENNELMRQVVLSKSKKIFERMQMVYDKYRMNFKNYIWYLYFDQRRSLAQIAKIIGMSRTHTKRIFKGFKFIPRDKRESHLGKKQSKWTKLKRARALKGKKRSKQAIRNVMRRRTPTGLETEFQRIVNKYNLPYKYVGNGSFILENCNPDFINTDGKKIAVEVFARYYKSRDGRNIDKWKEKRSEIFSKYGWRVVYFNELQVTDKVVSKVLRTVVNIAD